MGQCYDCIHTYHFKKMLAPLVCCCHWICKGEAFHMRCRSLKLSLRCCNSDKAYLYSFTVHNLFLNDVREYIVIPSFRLRCCVHFNIGCKIDILTILRPLWNQVTAPVKLMITNGRSQDIHFIQNLIDYSSFCEIRDGRSLEMVSRGKEISIWICRYFLF